MVLRRLALLLILLIPSFVSAYETLQIIRPVTTGVAGTGLNSSNRIYRAYPGITYEIHADARGGHWPYTYSLSNAPTGMTIEAGPCTDVGPSCTAGTITWTNPQTTCSTCTAGVTASITVTVTDADNTQVTGSWTVTVSNTIGADGFCFIDAVNGNDAGAGSLASPYKTLPTARTSCGARSILYLRAGTYVTSGLPHGAGDADYGYVSSWAESSAPIIWIGYPGETATIDFGWTTTGVEIIELSGKNIWIDHLTAINTGSMMFHFVRGAAQQWGSVARHMTFSGILDGNQNQNSAFIMYKRDAGNLSYFDTVQNSTFTNIHGQVDALTDSGCAVKLYSTTGAVIETSSFNDMTTINTEAMIAMKGEGVNFTIRANKIGMTTPPINGIGGNLATDLTPTSGEIYHNVVSATGDFVGYYGTLNIGVARTNAIGAIAIYRNTFLGDVGTVNITSSDGPFTFTSNVIASGAGTGGSCPARLYCDAVTDYTRIVVNANNLQGANDGSIVNATTGALQPAYTAQYLGNTGFELSASSPSVSRRFAPLFNLRR